MNVRLTRRLIEMNENERTARIFKALCDPNRLMILRLLRDGEKCACDLLDELEIGQPTLSHHMRILCDSGLVQSRKEGKWSYYSFSPDGVQNAKDLLNEVIYFNTQTHET
jgi:ArsR family transcriptional regulator